MNKNPEEPIPREVVWDFMVRLVDAGLAEWERTPDGGLALVLNDIGEAFLNMTTN